MDYISVGEATTKWGISENRIPDVARFSRMWLIPKKSGKAHRRQT